MEIKAKSLVAEQLLQLRRLALFISPHWHSQCRLMLFLLQAQPQLCFSEICTTDARVVKKTLCTLKAKPC